MHCLQKSTKPAAALVEFLCHVWFVKGAHCLNCVNLQVVPFLISHFCLDTCENVFASTSPLHTTSLLISFDLGAVNHKQKYVQCKEFADYTVI